MTMNRRNHLGSTLKTSLACAVATALGGALLAGPSGANDLQQCVDGAYFSGHAYLCDYYEGAVTPPAGNPPFTEIEGAEETWYLETDYNCTTGIEIITWDMILNKAGKGERWGEIVMQPYAYSGTFVESIYLKGGKMSKSGTYTGTGDLDDFMIDYQIVRSKYVPEVSPCDPDPTLYILDFTGYVYSSE
jgi:hypothetical protein